MTDISHDPQNVINEYTSSFRNVIASSGVGFASMGLSNHFIHKEIVFKIISLLILSFSILYGINFTNNIKNYIKHINLEYEEDKNINDYVFLFEQMNVRFYLTYIYLSILFIIILIILFYLIKLIRKKF
tara:strand:+ start:326 stop:712 length:387 start_codon:yes stop_codon:yes gene_type:complete